MGDSLSLKLLTTPAEELLEIARLNDYKFNFTDMFGDRGDIINKDMPRQMELIPSRKRSISIHKKRKNTRISKKEQDDG